MNHHGTIEYSPFSMAMLRRNSYDLRLPLEMSDYKVSFSRTSVYLLIILIICLFFMAIALPLIVYANSRCLDDASVITSTLTPAAVIRTAGDVSDGAYAHLVTAESGFN